VSDGDKVFEFFDDFESGVIDTTNKWEPGGTATIVDNSYPSPYPIGEDKVLDVNYDHYLYSKNTFPPPFAYRCSSPESFKIRGKLYKYQKKNGDRKAKSM